MLRNQTTKETAIRDLVEQVSDRYGERIEAIESLYHGALRGAMVAKEGEHVIEDFREQLDALYESLEELLRRELWLQPDLAAEVCDKIDRRIVSSIENDINTASKLS